MTENDYRFTVSEHDGTITRGRMYQLPSDWTTDSWTHYWDCDGMVAFIDGGWDGLRPVPGCESEETDRAIAAHKAEQDTMTGSSCGLDRLAKRLAGNDTARFIVVSLDRGTDLYALSYGGDPDRVWADEIEAVNYGDIYRIECEEYQPGMGYGSGDWVPADEYPEEWYGESVATAEFERIFEQSEFPADLLVGASD